MHAIPLLALLPILGLTALSDLRELRIPNTLVLAAVTVFAITAVFLPMAEIWLRLVAAGLCFLTLFVIYCFGILGGGDVKMLAAISLFVPSPLWSIAPYVFSVALLVGVAITVALQSVPNSGNAEWASLRHSGKFPMGISIAMTGVALLILSLTFT